MNQSNDWYHDQFEHKDPSRFCLRHSQSDDKASKESKTNAQSEWHRSIEWGIGRDEADRELSLIHI